MNEDYCSECGSVKVPPNLIEIANAVREYSGYAWSFWESSYRCTIGEAYLVPKVGKVTLIDRNFDNDSNYFMVWEIGGEYYKVTGSYSSYNDTYWDGFKKVDRQEKTVYVYE